MQDEPFDFEIARRALDKMGIIDYAFSAVISNWSITAKQPTDDLRDRLQQLFAEWETIHKGCFNPDGEKLHYNTFPILMALGVITKVEGKPKHYVWHGIKNLPTIDSRHAEYTIRKNIPKHILYVLQHQSIVDRRHIKAPKTAKHITAFTFTVLAALGLIQSLGSCRYAEIGVAAARLQRGPTAP